MVAGSYKPVQCMKSLTNRRTNGLASFVGMENLFEGAVVSQKGGIITADIGNATIEAVANNERGDTVILGIRPETLPSCSNRLLSSARNTFNGTVKQIIYLGPINKVIIDCGFFASRVTSQTSPRKRSDLIEAAKVSVAFKATGVNVISKGQRSRKTTPS